MLNIESFDCGTTYYDSIHFPRGFGRSGQFTRREAELLGRCGHVITRLSTGQLEASNPEQHAMLEVLFGEREPETELEKLWSKYQKMIHTKVRKISACSGRENQDFYEGGESSSF
ncbi:MAG: DUF413 domain-containing protein [Oleiphilus sp.]|nr:MAG: DUF413 domain-containing protein [Oleiphilus sp.]